MIIIPAIDLRGGQCVRLIQGDYAREKSYDDNPAERALYWEKNGAELIHLVDLDGARSGHSANIEAIRSIRQAVKCRLEAGGGIRSVEDAEILLKMGIDRVILGTIAARDPVPVDYLAKTYPGRIILGADARNEMVSVQGWQSTGSTNIYDFASSFNHLPLAGVLFTDIATDGMLTGPNFDAQRRMGERITNPLLASGGVGSLDDIRKLAQSGIPNLYGVVVGMALYEQKFTLQEAIAEAANAG